MSAARHDVHIPVTQEQFHRFVTSATWCDGREARAYAFPIARYFP